LTVEGVALKIDRCATTLSFFLFSVYLMTQKENLNQSSSSMSQNNWLTPSLEKKVLILERPQQN